MMNKIKIGALNCQGIKEKFETPEFLEIVQSCLVFGVCETWLKKGENTIKVEDYNFYPYSRKTEKGSNRGGVGLFIKNEFKKWIKVLYDISNEYCIWCKLKKDFFKFKEDMYIAMIYIPPQDSSREKRIQTDHFKNILATYASLDSEHVLLMGDMNARTNNYEDVILYPGENDNNLTPQDNFFLQKKFLRNNQDHRGNKYGKKLIELCHSTNSYIINGRTLGDFQGRFTCYETNGNSVVDYMIANEKLTSYINNFQVSDPSISDHCKICLEISLPRELMHAEDKILCNNAPKRVIWNEISKMQLKRKLEDPSTENKIERINMLLDGDESEIDACVDILNDIYTLKHSIRKKSDKFFKKKKCKKWYDQTCQEASKRLKNIGILLAKNPYDPFLRGKFYTVRKEYKKLLKHKKWEWKRGMIELLEKAEEKNPVEYWNIIKQMREKETNNTISNPENFKTFFENLFSPDDNKELSTEQKQMEKEVFELLQNRENISQIKNPFTLKELKEAIIKLKNKKASGPDGILAEMIKSSPEKLQNIILYLINKVVITCYYPKKWAEAITSLILKEGDEEDPNNYRAITVASAISKLLAIMLDNRLESFIRDNKLMTPLQIGFEKKARPADHLFVLKNLIDTYATNNKKLYACFIDFQKAYDSVWRIGLYYKLIKSGVDIEMVRLLKNMYDKTTQTLKINGKLTLPFKTSKGVRQGCVLSPRLFNLFINDIPEIFDEQCDPVKLGTINLQCLLYADDIVVFSETKNGLQRCMKKIEAYTEKWKMNLNRKKTKIVVFQKQGGMSKVNIQFHGQTLEQVKQYKYLGTIISRNGTFNINSQYLKGKGLRARFLVTKTIGMGCKANTIIKIFEKMVEPILLYNCEIVQMCMPKNITFEKFENRMWNSSSAIDNVVYGLLRQVLSLQKKTPNLGMLAEVGKHPLCTNIYIQTMKYYVRLTSSDNILLKNALLEATKRYQEGKVSWLKQVMFLRKTTKLDNIIELSKKPTSFITKFKKELYKSFEEYWQQERTKDSKLRFYFEHKREFKYEKYLDYKNRKHRTAITKMRLSSHKLPIESMRMQKVIRENRLCPLCEDGSVGDEWHYLKKCTNRSMIDIRTIFKIEIIKVQQQFSKMDLHNILHYCLQCHDDVVIGPLGKYIYDILEVYDLENEKQLEKDINCIMM